jgi:hypothetical protein
MILYILRYTLINGKAVIGSIDDMIIEISRISFDDNVPKKESLISNSKMVKRLTVITVDMIPKNTMVPIF